MPIATKTWTVGAVLPASDLNTYVRDAIAEIDPSSASPGQVLKVNADSDGYDFGGVDVPISAVRWGADIGAKYFVNFGDALMGTNGTNVLGAANALLDAGWGLIGVTFDVTADGDFLSSADPATGAVAELETAADGLVSPIVFGDYNHARAAQELLGAMPTKLVVKIMARFTTASNDEDDSGVGLYNQQGVNGSEILIYSDGTNFRLRMTATATEDAGAVVDTDWHLFEIHVEANSTSWYIDEVLQGTIAEDADDQWPMGVGGAIRSSTGANDIHIGWMSVEYQL